MSKVNVLVQLGDFPNPKDIPSAFDITDLVKLRQAFHTLDHPRPGASGTELMLSSASAEIEAVRTDRREVASALSHVLTAHFLAEFDKLDTYCGYPVTDSCITDEERERCRTLSPLKPQ